MILLLREQGIVAPPCVFQPGGAHLPWLLLHFLAMKHNKLNFDEVTSLIGHIGEEERHFNGLEMEYRKLASQWLLAALGAIGFVLSREHVMFIAPWVLVICISVAASVGILVIWLLDLKVYHELLHAAFKQGVRLETEYPEYLPPIRKGMVDSQTGGDVIKRVIFFYFFSILLLLIIANVSVWVVVSQPTVAIGINVVSVIVVYFLYRMMTNKSARVF